MQTVDNGIASYQADGVVLGSTDDFAWVDLGTQSLGIMCAAELGPLQRNGSIRVSVMGADPEDLRLVTISPFDPPKDWNYLTAAFERKAPITGTVTGFVKGGLAVDVGAPAFMPASRSGAQNSGEMENLIGQQVLCLIVEIDPEDLNIVVDRRQLLEAADLWSQQRALQALRPGATVRGTVCTLTDFGAFVDLGDVDGLLHVRDISWEHTERPSDVLSLGQEVEVVIDKVDSKRGRVALSMKALRPDPWAAVATKFKAGDRVRGKVTTINEFGIFVELEPGVEGRMQCPPKLRGRRQSPAGDALKPGDFAEFTILQVNASERRIALDRGPEAEDPWKDLEDRYHTGDVVTGTITRLISFGAFVDLNDEVEGLIHVSDIDACRVEHPADRLSLGQVVSARVLEADSARRRLRLGLKQMADGNSTAVVERGLPPIVDEAPANSGEPDFRLYGQSVVIGHAEGHTCSEIAAAAIFAVIDCGLVPRTGSGGSLDELMSAIRESKYAIHESSRSFEAGLFLGCQTFGADPHRQKQSLTLSPESRAVAQGNLTTGHRNDPEEVIRLVRTWLASILGEAIPQNQGIQLRYRRFRDHLANSRLPNGPSEAQLQHTEVIRMAREWLQRERGKTIR